MTPQEAINRIYLHSDTMLEEEAALIIESLRKQIPERPIHVNKNKKFDGNWKKVCPMCRRVLMERTTTETESFPTYHNISPHCICGQAINWRDWE